MMKSTIARYGVLAVLAVAAALAMCPRAVASGLNWEIESFDVTLVVEPDGTLDVTERIVADFSREGHHGIFREIPYAYRRAGTSFKLRIDIESVTDEAGRPHRFQKSRHGGHLRVRIGDPNQLVRRPVTYNLRYRVKRALLGFDTHDELYWNATGTRWPVRMQRASCEVMLPEAAIENPGAVRTASYIGPHGSRAEGPAASRTPSGHLRFEVPSGLAPWSGLTVVAGFPTGHVAAPTVATRAGWFLADNSILLAPVIVFAGLWLLWRAAGRDLGTPGSIAVRYEPPEGLTPVEVGTIVDERMDRHDVTATIIDLAIRGHLKIDAPMNGAAVESTGIRLIRRQKSEDGLKRFERLILERLFDEGDDVTLDSLEAKFYKTLSAVRTQVYYGLRRSRYFVGDLPWRRGLWMGVGAFCAAVTILVMFLLFALNVFAPVSTFIAGVLTAALFPVFARIMPRKTAKGRRALEHIKGLEEYLTRAELPILELAERRGHFEKLLPYAMALNLSAVWARKFADIYDQPPEWLATDGHAGLTAAVVAHHLTRSSAVMTRSLSVTPRSQFSSSGFGGGSSGFGGGGFSGGGGGGGGGGAW
ncbi:MAG: DUF2207 domain-containing protein [Planctomycetota bacterium]|jgi:uncharacterized membrane protein YgcG